VIVVSAFVTHELLREVIRVSQLFIRAQGSDRPEGRDPFGRPRNFPGPDGIGLLDIENGRRPHHKENGNKNEITVIIAVPVIE